MQPHFNLRIRSMLKALMETVLPAVDPDNKTAIEQLNIVLGSLALLKDQVEYVHWFEFVETADMVELATLIAGELGPESDDLLDQARQAAERASDPLLPLSGRQKGNNDLRDALVRLIERSFAADVRIAGTVRSTVLTFSARQIGRERAFVAGTNLDVFADNLQSIEDSLKSSPSACH